MKYQLTAGRQMHSGHALQSPSAVGLAFSMLAIVGLYSSLIGPLQFALPVPASSAILLLLALLAVTTLKNVSVGVLLFYASIVVSGLVGALIHEGLGVINNSMLGRIANLTAVALAAAFVTTALARQCLWYFHRLNTIVLMVALAAYCAMLATGVDLFPWARDEFHGTAGRLLRLRHTFIFSEPAYLCSLVAIHIAALAVLKDGLRRLELPIIALFSTTLFLTFSFSGMITLVALLLLLIREKRLNASWALALAVIAVAIVYITIAVESYLFDRAALVIAGAKEEPRLIEFLRGFDALKCGNWTAFAFGHGTGAYGVVNNTCYADVNHQTSNNTLADLLFENGVLMVLVALAVLIGFARRTGVAPAALLFAAAMYKIELFGVGAVYYVLIYRASLLRENRAAVSDMRLAQPTA